MIAMRLSQEAPANAERRARAQRVKLTLQCGDRGARLEVRDDGRGFQAGPPRDDIAEGGYGLTAIREMDARHLVSAGLSGTSRPRSRRDGFRVHAGIAVLVGATIACGSAIWELEIPIGLIGLGNALIASPVSTAAIRNLPLSLAGGRLGRLQRHPPTWCRPR